MRNTSLLRRVGVPVLALAVGMFGARAIANDTNIPADKTAVAGSTVQSFGPGTTVRILHEKMKVSSPADLILGVTLECSILTSLFTEGGANSTTETDTTQGKVDIHLKIDGEPVRVQSSNPDGTVTFCNREYSRTVTDKEDGADGLDEEYDYIRTKNANAFNWVALNVGEAYDNLANGNNIVDVEVFATYTGGAPGSCLTKTTCSEAYVGKRTLVIEPVHAQVGEVSEPTDTDGQEAILPL